MKNGNSYTIKIIVAVHGLKLEIGNWEEQYKSMKAKFPISMFHERLQILFILLSCQILFQKAKITYHAHRTWFDEDPSKGSKSIAIAADYNPIFRT